MGFNLLVARLDGKITKNDGSFGIPSGNFDSSPWENHHVGKSSNYINGYVP